MSTEDEKILIEAKKLPWEDRLSHTNWKVRNDANIDLAALCGSITDPKDPRIRELGRFFKKSIADSIAAVQDKALDALISYLKAADADAGRYAKEVCDSIVEKCLTSEKPKTVEKAQIVFMLWLELEAVDVFLDAMEKAIKNKVAVIPAIDVMRQALSEFGSKIVPPNRILKIVSQHIDRQDQSVQDSTKQLAIEIFRWIGGGPENSILSEKMRDTKNDEELKAGYAYLMETAKPTRKIRSEQHKEVEQEVEETEAAGAVSQEINQYEPPADILTLLDKSGFWNGVKATNWSERREAVAELTKLASTKRIAAGDFTEICPTLKMLITDVNIAVRVEAVRAICNLALGLRTSFSESARFLLPFLLEKLKEKKPTMTEALTNTLQAIHKAGCVTLADIVEDVAAAVKNKVPLVRSLTLKWIKHCIETSNKAILFQVYKEYVQICMECLNDATPDVRDAAVSALAAIAKFVDMRPLEKVYGARLKKLSEMIGVSGGGARAVRCSGGTISSRSSAEVCSICKWAMSKSKKYDAKQRVRLPGDKKAGDGLELEVYNQGMSKTKLFNKWQETGACSYGDSCHFAHGISGPQPVIRHPGYKTEVCRMVLAGDICPYGHLCHYRHSLANEENAYGCETALII